MSLSKLRRPDFKLSFAVASSAAGTSRDYDPNGCVSTISAQSLVNYTRQCHKRLTSSMLPTPVHDENDIDGGQDHHQVNSNISVPSAASSSLMTGGIGVDNNNNNNHATPNLEQCIILLEPILKIFQTSCIINDKAKRNESGRNDEAKTNKGAHNDIEGEEEEEEDEDEIPPQLLRAAKFFPYRFIPMKRALLRPPTLPLSLPSVSGKGGNQQEYPKNGAKNTLSHSSAVELSLHYRLRLARACWKRGLVAAAEYEALQISMERIVASKKRKGRDNIDANYDQLKKKYNKTFSTSGDVYDDDNHEETNNFVERIRLSFLRLPTEAIHPHRSIAAWNHVKEMVSQCNTIWEKATDEEMKKTVIDDGTKSLVTPNQVADWAMTSWTALLLLRGLDCVKSPPPASSTKDSRNNHRDASISSIEIQLAVLLTNRTGTSSNANMPVIGLARAVERRINMLLHPENIQSLNGIHLFSLGRLMASFHNRNDALQHIAISVCHCAIENGGMTGLEQLSRLLAVFLCSSTSMNENQTKSTAIVEDAEATLRVKLDDDEFITSIVNVIGETHGTAGRHSPSSVKRKAKSFLEAILSTTAHLVKCCE